jgi:hypothetical protein
MVRQLFEEYGASLSFESCFQNFQQELDHRGAKTVVDPIFRTTE